MNKTSDKFCPYCVHHLYQDGANYWCQECGVSVSRAEALGIAERKRDEQERFEVALDKLMKKAGAR